MNMKKIGCHNVSKHREIKVSDKHVALEILLKFGSLDKMGITYSETKNNLVISGKELINPLGLKSKNKAEEIQKGKACHQK